MSNKVVRAYVISQSLHQFSLGWHFGVYVIFLLDRGISLPQAMLLNLTFMTVSSLFDPYTGSLADKYGQKRVHIWGEIAWAAAMVFYGIGNRFGHFMVAEMIAAIGAAFMSGALESWLRNNVDEKIAHEAVSQSGMWSSLASIPSAILGGVIGATVGLSWPWIIAGFCGSLTTLVLYHMLKELPEGRHWEIRPTSRPGVRIIIRNSIATPQLRFALGIALVYASAMQAFNMLWAPIMMDISGSSAWLGFVWLGVAIATALGARIARWKRINISRSSIALTLFSIGLPIAVTPLLSGPLVLAAFLLHEVGRGAIRPLLSSYYNRYFDDYTRSTAASVQSTAGTIGSALGLLICSVLTAHFSPISVWGISAIALIAVSLYVFFRR